MGAPTMSGWSFANITTATTTTSNNGRFLSHIVINGGTLTGDITIYDNTAASGTTVGTIAGGADLKQGQSYPYLLNLANGLTVVTASASNITVVYKNK